MSKFSMLRAGVAQACRFSAILLFAGVLNADESGSGALIQHMQPMLTATTEQWQTPNPQFDGSASQPSHFGLRLLLSDDKSHVFGELTGLYETGHEAVYWTLYAFYNPVSHKVIAVQIGWEGTLMLGEAAARKSGAEELLMLSYGSDGVVKAINHKNQFVDANTHISRAFEQSDDGQWVEQSVWKWVRRDVAAYQPRQASGDSKDAIPELAYFLNGEGQWRAPNPDYEPGKDEDKVYGMNYRVGAEGRHIIMDIVAVDGNNDTKNNYTLVLVKNPVTNEILMLQTGAGGVFFRGRHTPLASRQYQHDGLVYLPNGIVKYVRDIIEIQDQHAYVLKAYERNSEGMFEQIREWKWQLQRGEQ